MNQTVHTAVLVEETMLALDVRSGGRYLDGTLGGGMHTSELLKRSSPNGRVIACDVDRTALARCREQIAPSFVDRLTLVEQNFRHLDRVASEAEMVPLDGILLDLGCSSDALDDPAKGLSFRHDGPLDMRFGPRANDDGLTAAEIVNSWSAQDVETILRRFGEERFAGRIAREIVLARKHARIVGTLDLAAIIRKAVPLSYEHGRIHPATRTFQALRIVVNDELVALQDAIIAATHVLAHHGRLSIITFHSLEDRIVKQTFRDRDAWQPLTKKPTTPTPEEVARNPRARSAKLRTAIFHSHH